MNNILYIDKPSGMTSFDLCFKLRKVLNTKRIGHTGTLDPLATGVMIILYDKATKANQFLVSHNKTYQTKVLFGVETDTLDIDGNIISKQEYQVPDKALLSEILNSFIGKSMQVVPKTSAVKIDGKRLYQYQKQNIHVKLPSREIEVFSIELLDIFEDGFSFVAEVSSGTYIRALVRDILAKLNMKGCVSQLRRIAIDNITIDMCDKLDDVLNGNYHNHNLLELLENRYSTYEYENIDDIKNGKRIKIDCDEERIIITNNNELLAIYEKVNDEYRCLRGLW